MIWLESGLAEIGVPLTLLMLDRDGEWKIDSGIGEVVIERGRPELYATLSRPLDEVALGFLIAGAVVEDTELLRFEVDSGGGGEELTIGGWGALIAGGDGAAKAGGGRGALIAGGKGGLIEGGNGAEKLGGWGAEKLGGWGVEKFGGFGVEKLGDGGLIKGGGGKIAEIFGGTWFWSDILNRKYRNRNIYRPQSKLTG